VPYLAPIRTGGNIHNLNIYGYLMFKFDSLPFPRKKTDTRIARPIISPIQIVGEDINLAGMSIRYSENVYMTLPEESNVNPKNGNKKV